MADAVIVAIAEAVVAEQKRQLQEAVAQLPAEES